MKKIFLFVVLFSLISLPVLAQAAGLVPCGNPGEPACTLGHLFQMLGLIYNFIVYTIAVPLATLIIIVGGVLILVSGGNPEMAGRGKKALMAGVIGLVLVFCSWVIINTVMSVLGYSLGSWYQLPI